MLDKSIRSALYYKKVSFMKKIILQDYIKTIATICLNENKERIKLAQVAEKLAISTSAVSEMVKKLVVQNLLENHSHQGINLTSKGWKLGMQLIRNHRLWEVFLSKVLKLKWDEIHDEAENLEHAASEQLMDKIDCFLGYPSYDPHGNPIPSKSGEIAVYEQEILLANSDLNKTYIIKRFISFKPNHLKHLAMQGLVVGAKIKILEQLDFDNSIFCEVENTLKVTVTSESANQIYLLETK